jgi:hypothetical protein
VDVNKVLNGFNNPQIIEGIEATFGPRSDGSDEPLSFVEAKGGYGDPQFSGRNTYGISRF